MNYNEDLRDALDALNERMALSQPNTGEVSVCSVCRCAAAETSVVDEQPEAVRAIAAMTRDGHAICGACLWGWVADEFQDEIDLVARRLQPLQQFSPLRTLLDLSDPVDSVVASSVLERLAEIAYEEGGAS